MSLLIDRLADRLDRESEQIASRGTPAGARKVSDSDQVKAWAARDPAVDYETLREKLATTGLTAEEAGRMIVFQRWPEWLPLYAQPAPSEQTADVLARMAEWPLRWDVLWPMGEDPGAMVKEAERLDRLMERDTGAAAPEEGGQP